MLEKQPGHGPDVRHGRFEAGIKRIAEGPLGALDEIRQSSDSAGVKLMKMAPIMEDMRRQIAGLRQQFAKESYSEEKIKMLEGALNGYVGLVSQYQLEVEKAERMP